LTDHESHRNIGRPRDNEQGDDRRPQYTTADNQLSRTDGQTTLISGISGTTLSYLPGDLVDNAYQLTKLLGRGGMGAVFECKHLALDRVYALKLLSADQLSREAWIRFQAEAQSLGA
jgi:serine/threonine protein kinase